MMSEPFPLRLRLRDGFGSDYNYLFNYRDCFGSNLAGHDPARSNGLRPLCRVSHAKGLLANDALSLGGDLAPLLGLVLDLVLVKYLLYRDLLAQRPDDLLLGHVLYAFALRRSGHKVDVCYLKQLFDDQLSAPVAIGEGGNHLLGAKIGDGGRHIGSAHSHGVLDAVLEEIEHICAALNHQDGIRVHHIGPGRLALPRWIISSTRTDCFISSVISSVSSMFSSNISTRMRLALSMTYFLLEARTSSMRFTAMRAMHGPTRSMVSRAAARMAVS